MDRERALALYDEGRAAMARRDLLTAVAKLGESVAIFPTAPAVAALGESLLGVSRTGEAVVHLSAALQMGVSGSHLRMLLASALGHLGERAEAIEQLKIVLAEQADNRSARAELQRILADPVIIARTANRHRLLHELRLAVPDLRFSAGKTTIEVLRSIGVYVGLSIEVGRGDERLIPVFQFLNRLAVSPDQDVSDLLAGAVFPALAAWQTTVEVARRMLVGKGRVGFDAALALWGEPTEHHDVLSQTSLQDAFRLIMPDFRSQPEWRFDETAAAFGRHLVDSIRRGASDDQLADAFRLLSRLDGTSSRANEAFEIALGELADSRQPRVRETALRLLTGDARSTFERLM